MAFPNFFGKQYESASNFLDDLEMAFLVSGRDEEEVKLRAFPLVLKDSAKNWFQNLEPGRKTNWETLKETFLSKYGGLDNPEHLWHRISSLHQATSRTYLTYESQFLRLWAEWEASLAEGERAPNFLKKEKFLAGLFPDLQEKVKEKFPETFEEALQIARVKDRKLEYQAHTSRVEHPQGPTMADERLPPAPTTTPEDPHLELLQRVTNQLDSLSINMVQGVRQQQPQPNNERMPNGPRRQPQRRDYFCYNCGEEGHGMYFCPHPRNFNAQAGRGRQQVTPPRARPPPQIQPQILQNPQMVAQPQVLQRSVTPQPIAEIPPLPNNNANDEDKILDRHNEYLSTHDSSVEMCDEAFIASFSSISTTTNENLEEDAANDIKYGSTKDKKFHPLENEMPVKVEQYLVHCNPMEDHDLKGPLPRTANGKLYIFVAIDYMTRWVEAQSVARVNEKTMSRFVYTNIVCRFGTPLEIIFDNGPGFRKGLLIEVCEELNIEHRHSTPYYPQSNGLVERANGISTGIIRKMV
ncbi:hypothetical protein L7F22_042606 [Adiantum nelumboides]|nr:hypothetical protein [Adiantum nelumboides]